jgi:hypothetical protein
VWLGGEVRGAVTVAIDGRPVGRLRHALSYKGHYMPVGEIALARGRHEVTLEHTPGGLHPGAGGAGEALGPLVLSVPEPPQGPPLVFSRRPGDLCGQVLDWIERIGL